MNYQIDWEEQWRLHAPNYKDGVVHLKLKDKTILLKPGPGFGDLSHPSTTLVIELMASLVQNKTVIDIGCGSGVLSLAASSLGAKKVLGVDIDPEAVRHSQENAKLNASHALFYTPQNLPKIQEPCIVVMNMITSEQEMAWGHYNDIWPYCELLVVSGILTQQKGAYIAKMKKAGWEPASEKKKKGWIAFILNKIHLSQPLPLPQGQQPPPLSPPPL